MDKFMLKMNHVKVQALCLKAEKTKLSKENIQLKHYIKKYLTELALKNEKDRPTTVKVQSGINKAEMPKMWVLNLHPWKGPWVLVLSMVPTENMYKQTNLLVL